jgi:nitrogen fixation/metabolism regulation signal transduction histidine kinase
MRLRTKFILLLGCIHTILILLSLPLLTYHKLLFLAAELFILLSIIISVRLYTAYIQPLNLISAGIFSIKEKDFNTKFVKVGQEELDQLIGVYNTMIDQLRGERVKQQEQNFFLERLIEASPVGIIVLDLDENIVALNPSAAQLLEVDATQVLQKPLSDLKGDVFEKLTLLESNTSETIQLGQKSLRLIKSHFIEKGFSRCFILLEELTEEIYRTEKNAYEKVIRVMSHEVNNSVGAVNSILNSSLHYQDQLTQDDREDFANALQVAIERNSKLNQFMTNFADIIRTPEPTKELCDVNTIIRHVTMLMVGSCEARNISLSMKLMETPFLVDVDTQQFEQVLLNIIKNSIEAVGENGWIEVETRKQEKKALFVRDNGKGISKDVQAQLFTPFYSTKKDGQGIGLTLTKEILRNHGFRFSLETIREGETEFTIVFD